MKKKKKILAGLLSLLIIALGSIGLTACQGECLHEWGEWTVKTAATCTRSGVKQSTCYICGKTKDREIEPTGHTPHEDDGDCTTAITCRDCGIVLTPGNPSHVGGTANCQHGAICEVCGTEYGEPTPHTGEVIWIKHTDCHYQVYACCHTHVTEPEAHTIVDGVCTVCGYKPGVSVSSEEVVVGQSQVSLTLSLDDNPGIVGMTVTIEYSDALVLTDAQSGVALNVLEFTKPETFTSGCTLLWDGIYVEDEDIVSGEFLTLTFDVSNTPVGSYNVLFTIKAYDNDLQPVSLAISGGTITINNN